VPALLRSSLVEEADPSTTSLPNLHRLRIAPLRNARARAQREREREREKQRLKYLDYSTSREETEQKTTILRERERERGGAGGHVTSETQRGHTKDTKDMSFKLFLLYVLLFR